MNEKPLERLHFFNGQRLQAEDFRLEQDYHMRVRRWLNRSLYTSGIASGLEVRKVPGSPSVIVGPGLALDHFGREIIQLDEREISLQGHGIHYLTIRYQEDTTARQDACCPPVSGSKNHTASGGPSRILAEPVLEWSTALPHEESGRGLLARVELGPGCKEVKVLDTSVRRYVGAASAAKVRQYALEGVREVAAIPLEDPLLTPIQVKAKILFHVRGRRPNSVTLYLKARELSALHYTEIGSHGHDLTISGATDDPYPALNEAKASHSHDKGTLKSDEDNPQNLTLVARKGYIGKSPNQEEGGAAFFLIERDWGVKIGLAENTGKVGQDIFDWLGNKISDALGTNPTLAPEIDDDTFDLLKPTKGVINGGQHGHSISGETATKGVDLTHTHSLSGTGASGLTGATDTRTSPWTARTGGILRYFHDLQIAVDGVDCTRAIRQQIINATPTDSNGSSPWILLGDGTEIHPLASDSDPAVEIKLDFLPDIQLDLGEHEIEFSVSPQNGRANGGLVQFNLYIE